MEVKVVNVLATVRDKQGKIINSLSQDDFILDEDGRPQTIKYFSRETDLPHESAGKRRSTGTGAENNWLKTALLESAWAAAHSRKSFLGAQFRRISQRRGPKRAGIAVAHSILVIAYHMLRNGLDFNDHGADYPDWMNTAKLKRYHLRRLVELGCDVSALAVSTWRFMGETGASKEKLKAAFALLLTLRGIPQIYYGDEIGMQGGDDPDNRRDFPGGFHGDARNAFQPGGRAPEEQEIFSHVQKLVQLRRHHPALRGGRQWHIGWDDSHYAFLRESARERLLVLFNNPRALSVPLGDTPLENVANSNHCWMPSRPESGPAISKLWRLRLAWPCIR